VIYYQQVAMLDTETGELRERRLEHANGEARAFYAHLPGQVRVGIEATGHTRWFERLLAELGHELWIGDAAQIRAATVRKQKTDARDAAHLLQLLVEERFPRIWRPSTAERDLRQLLWHRQKLVWMRNAIGNQLHALAMGVPQEATVHQERPGRVGEPASRSVGELSPARVADPAGPTRSLTQEVG
jgi:transposase